jgi:Ni/Fe-hydrogenase 1 B-type cytochrome subunit
VTTGWLIEMAPSVANAASDYHYILAAVLVGGLALRVGLLLFDKGVGHWHKLLPEEKERQTYKSMFLFYLSLGKMPLPKWYAHNPTWKPVYILFFAVLLLQILTGLVRDNHPIVLGFYLPGVHEFIASIILGFAVLHIAAVIIHDFKGTAADISAMINGHKIFVIQKPENSESPTVHPISLDQLKKNR